MIFETMAAAFVITSGWFWVGTVLTFLIILALSENDHNWLAGIFAGGFVYVVTTTNPTLFDWSWSSIIFVSLLYVVIGCLWSLAKWFFYVRSYAEAFKEYKLRWIRKYNKQHPNSPIAEDASVRLSQVCDDNLSNFHSFMRAHAHQGKLMTSNLPRWTNEKDRIVPWIMFWPTSFVWTMLNEPTVRMAKAAYQSMGKLFDSITKSVNLSVGVSDE